MDAQNTFEENYNLNKKNRRGRPKGSRNKKTLEKSCDIKINSSISSLKETNAEKLSELNNPLLLRNSILEKLKGELFGQELTKNETTINQIGLHPKSINHNIFVSNPLTVASCHTQLTLSNVFSQSNQGNYLSNSLVSASIQTLHLTSCQSSIYSHPINQISCQMNKIYKHVSSSSNYNNANNNILKNLTISDEFSSRFNNLSNFNECNLSNKTDNPSIFEVNQKIPPKLRSLQEKEILMTLNNFNKSKNINISDLETLSKTSKSNCIQVSNNEKYDLFSTLNAENLSANKRNLIQLENDIDLKKNNPRDSKLLNFTQTGNINKLLSSNSINNDSSGINNLSKINFTENSSILNYNNISKNDVSIKSTRYNSNDGCNILNNIKTKKSFQNDIQTCNVSEKLIVNSNNFEYSRSKANIYSNVKCFNPINSNMSNICSNSDNNVINNTIIDHSSNVSDICVFGKKKIEKKIKKNKVNSYSKISDPQQEIIFKEKMDELNKHLTGLILCQEGTSLANKSGCLNKKEKSTDCDSALIPLRCGHG